MRYLVVWIAVALAVGCASTDEALEARCRARGLRGSEHVCPPPQPLGSPLSFPATLGGLEARETELISAYRGAALRAEARHRGANAWNLIHLLEPCQARWLERWEAEGTQPEAELSFDDGEADWLTAYDGVALRPAAERDRLRQLLGQAFVVLRAHYAERLRLDLQEEQVQAFWLRSQDLFAITRHYLHEVSRDLYVVDPLAYPHERQRVRAYEQPLRVAQSSLAARFDQGRRGPLGTSTFERGVRALEVAFTCPLLPGASAPDILVQVAAVRRRQQLLAMAPTGVTERAGDEALDAALQATIDAERARQGADRIDELRQELEGDWVEPKARRPSRTE